jgi:hypothetical protein
LTTIAGIGSEGFLGGVEELALDASIVDVIGW